MMDFIPFTSTPVNKPRKASPQTETSKTSSNKKKFTNLPAFGSPAVGRPAVVPPFGAPAIPFGSPAVTNSPINRSSSPRHQNQQQFTPRGYNYNSSPRPRFNQQQNSLSPRQQNSYNFTPSPYSGRNNYRNSYDESSFKAPHQFSPGASGGGRGNGRKSFSKLFNQTPRKDRDCNAGGSLNIENYYHPSMVQDPWRNICPVIVQP